MDIIPLHLIWIQFWTNSCWTLFKTELFPTVASSVLFRCPSSRIERWMFFPQFQRCPGSSCSSSNGRVRSGVTHCGLHSDGEKKNGQGVNLREEERNPWNLSQKKFGKKRLWWVSILMETQQTISCFLALSFLCQLYISRYYQQKHGIVFMTRIFLFFEDGPAFNILSPISRNASLDKD